MKMYELQEMSEKEVEEINGGVLEITLKTLLSILKNPYERLV